jgi:hypothetical protein
VPSHRIIVPPCAALSALALAADRGHRRAQGTDAAEAGGRGLEPYRATGSRLWMVDKVDNDGAAVVEDAEVRTLGFARDDFDLRGE